MLVILERRPNRDAVPWAVRVSHNMTWFLAIVLGVSELYATIFESSQSIPVGRWSIGGISNIRTVLRTDGRASAGTIRIHNVGRGYYVPVSCDSLSGNEREFARLACASTI